MTLQKIVVVPILHIAFFGVSEIMLIANGVAKTPVSKKEIGRAKTFIVKHIEADMGVVNPADYMVPNHRLGWTGLG